MRISLVAAHDSKMEEEFSMFFSCFCYGPEFARGILGNSHPQTLRIRGIRGVDFIGVSVARVWCVRGRPNTGNPRADDVLKDLNFLDLSGTYLDLCGPIWSAPSPECFKTMFFKGRIDRFWQLVWSPTLVAPQTWVWTWVWTWFCMAK